MQTLLLALGSFAGFIIAYHTYGRWLARKLFRLNPEKVVPSVTMGDGVDYVPTRVEVLFGHHFTSIAGTGPIVGPAIAIMWGWVPALIWVLLGSIFIGAVHDFGALVVSVRNRGQTLGEVAGRAINPRVKFLFLLILFLTLLIVLAIFGMVIALVFKMFPMAIIPVWLQLPLAVGIGWWTYRRKGHLFWPALLVLGVMYATIWMGDYFVGFAAITGFLTSIPMWTWVIILLVYSYVASVLPVTTLLQPRDYINSHQLIVAMALLAIGIGTAAVGGLEGQPLEIVAPAVDLQPAGAPPMLPFLFVFIACGAVSGFHSLVSSGTSSKQLAREPDALVIGYGSMLTEGALAVMVICAVGAGIGMGNDLEFDKAGVASFTDTQGQEYIVNSVGEGVTVLKTGKQLNPADAQSVSHGDELELPGGSLVVGKAGDGTTLKLTGRIAWKKHYASWATAAKLGAKVGAFVLGAGNFLRSMGIPATMATAIMAVLIASFASTTLDTATRLQRYVVTELATTVRIKPLTGRHGATALAVVSAGVMALLPAPGMMDDFLAKQPGASTLDAFFATSGTGGLLLWPLFGASNQLLAGLALLVVGFCLLRRGRNVKVILIPAVLMLILPAWAMTLEVIQRWQAGQWHLVAVGVAILVLEAWMVTEAALTWRRTRGQIDPQLPTPPAAGMRCIWTWIGLACLLGLCGIGVLGALTPPVPHAITGATNASQSPDAVTEATDANWSPDTTTKAADARWHPGNGNTYDDLGFLDGLKSFTIKYHTTRYDNMYRGGDLLNTIGAKKLLKLEVTTIVSITPTETERKLAAEHGLRLVELPFEKDALSNETLAAFDDAVRAANGGVFVHCHDGKHRAGALMAHYRISHEGWPHQMAVAEYDILGGNPDK